MKSRHSKHVIFFAFINGFLSCATPTANTWLIERSEGRGVIGYRSNDTPGSSELLNTKFKQSADQICNGRAWKVVNDSLKSQQHVDTRMVPHTDWVGGTLRNETYDETVAKTTLQPRVYTYNESWREAVVECQEPVRPLTKDEFKKGAEIAATNLSPLRQQLDIKCKANQVHACYMLGKSFLRIGQMNDAKKYFRIGCSMKDQLSCLDAESVDADWSEERAKSYSRMCVDGNALACLSLGNAEMARKNDISALSAWKRACEKGEDSGCGAVMSVSFFKNNTPVDKNTAHQLCFRGQSAACNVAAAIAWNEGDTTTARSLFDKGCVLGDALCCAISNRSISH